MLTFSSAMNTLITLLQGIKYHYAVDIGTNLFTQTNIINNFQFGLMLVC